MEYLLFALFIKHAIADLFIQSFRKPGNKGKLFSRTNYLHCLDHAVLTAIVFGLFGYSLYVVAIMFAIDFTLHYLIDHFKTRFVRHMGWGRDGRAFWRLQAFDQMAHYATYMLLVISVQII